MAEAKGKCPVCGKTCNLVGGNNQRSPYKFSSHNIPKGTQQCKGTGKICVMGTIRRSA